MAPTSKLWLTPTMELNIDHGCKNISAKSNIPMSMVWHGVAWHGMAWYCMVWYGKVMYKPTSYPNLKFKS